MFALTFCGYYCSFSSLVGVFFFVVLGIMEARQNPFLGEHYHKKYDYPPPSEKNEPPHREPKDDSEDDWKANFNRRAIVFFILAGINLVFMAVCYICGN